MKDNLKKVMEGVESVLSFKQSDFGLVATDYFEQLENGERDEIDLYIAFKKMEKFVETILPFIKDKVDETKLSVSYKKYNVSLQAQNTRPYYDFTSCKDDYWEELKVTQEVLKEREDYLKTITTKTELIDEETGEVTILYPPIKKQGTAIVLRYEKI